MYYLGKHTDNVIMSEYSGMPFKGEGRSEGGQGLVGDEGEAAANKNARSVIIFDKQPSQSESFSCFLDSKHSWNLHIGFHYCV